MKNILIIVGIVVFVLGCVGTSYAPDTPKYKVYVAISSNEDDKTEADIVESHLKKELRALGDVVIVDEKGDWQFRISVNILGMIYKDGSKTPNVSIASGLDRRIPKYELRDYHYVAPLIPVYAYGPASGYWGRDNLPEWCVSEANSFDKLLNSYRNQKDIGRRLFLYYP